MPPTLRRLLSNPELDLRLLTSESALPAQALDQVVQWVHSSDLADPTPFLSDGQVLLITGTQFAPAATTAADFLPYVERLRARGLAGLGFGTEVIRDGTPDGLVAACLEAGLPLFEVPYRIPFIAVSRYVADLTAEELFARNTWALKAQRAISLAALRPDGLTATLAELSRQLDHWVALFDATGSVDRVFPPDALGASTLAAVSAEATRLLRTRRRSSGTIVTGGETLTLQTLGTSGQLRGVLALGGAGELDQAGQQVVTSVIALAGLALEQNTALDRAVGHLRSGLWHVLVSGDTQLASDIAVQMWGAMPAEPVRVALVDSPIDGVDALSEWLELRVAEHPGALFYAADDGRIVLCFSSAAPTLVVDLTAGFGLKAGVSDAVGYADLARAHDQATQALDRAREGDEGVVSFDTISRQGVLAFLARTDAREVARTTLAPLITADEANGSVLVLSLRTWLEHNGTFDSAARELGIHRHTLRARVAEAERLLGRDLSSFHARADLWAALLATRA
ncbi:PucR family transcriptional regulator [Diaminobutyricibacter tongyongensis]|uniref:PucR family transcriptional regulator n=1 Tax=Leifsonia tongyongensis TaxID=1268043 RepID=A0A6L9Y233_9MICO|nr:PucR family transcriptional regulator [Diaminobutyricibacter tongyongensis]NEN07741.1 PucR family transcriptional regulator [Diaminobutyricibacter tongyongensis]